MKLLKTTSLVLCLLGGVAAAQKETDIVVRDKTVVQRCVLAGASARMVAVGMPGGFNYAFDGLRCAPVEAWFGGFLDFNGETNGRGGNGCKPLGARRSLGMDPVPFRLRDPEALPGSVLFRGYRRNPQTGEPTFLFEVDGFRVEQRVGSSGADCVTLELVFPGGEPVEKFYRLNPSAHVLVELGEGIRWSGPGILQIAAAVRKAEVKIQLKTGGKAFVREAVELTGAELYRNFCSACHSTDGTKLIGPTFKGLWGREELVTRNGKPGNVTVDEAYVRESILDPQAAIVQGYEQVPMANFSGVLTKEQVERLMAYLKGLE
jgi:mono/diheme cytochrome c family protein